MKLNGQKKEGRGISCRCLFLSVQSLIAFDLPKPADAELDTDDGRCDRYDSGNDDPEHREELTLRRGDCALHR